VGVLFFTFIGTQGPSAADRVSPELSQELTSLGVPAAAQPGVLTTFKDCSDRRLSSADPSAVPLGCSAANAAPGSPQAQIGAALASAGKQVGGESFLQSQRRILWLFAGMLVVVMGLSLALPRRTAGHGG